jgi:RNA-directed DNA polymerase
MSDLLTQLSLAALLSRRELMTLLSSAPYRYKVYQIEKRVRGQFRTIAQPAREVKTLQYWVMKHVLSSFEIHEAATAYRQGLSIAHNARPHAANRFLLKMDFRDFFPSLKARDFRTFLKRQQSTFDADEIGALCSILFWVPKDKLVPDLCLSIGAPSSPMLSNILMFDFDHRIAGICRKRGVAYTRYADDLSFSSARSEDLAVAEKAVMDFCERVKSPLLVVNQAKTVRVSRAKSRRVTGLVLSNDRKVSLGRETKRRIRAWMHHFATGRLEPEEIIKLRGMLAFVNSVESTFMRRLRRKYGDDTVARCLAWTGNDSAE